MSTHTCLLCQHTATHVNRYTWSYYCTKHALEKADWSGPSGHIELLPAGQRGSMDCTDCGSPMRDSLTLKPVVTPNAGESPAPASKSEVSAYTRPPKHHDLKCFSDSFWAIGNRSKKFELRWNDRDFQEGDSVTLREWDEVGAKFTGHSLWCRVGFMLHPSERYTGIKDGFCIWSVLLPDNFPWPPTDEHAPVSP